MKNQKKLYQNFTKEQQEIYNQYKCLNPVNVKLTDIHLKKLKTAVKNKKRSTLRMSLRKLDENYLPHVLLLTTRQKTKLGNAFNNNMPTDIKLSKTQISKIIQSG